MSIQNGQRKHGTARGSPRRTCTAKASGINRSAAKSRCAREWGAWGRLSVEGLGHYNPDRSEGPWGRGAKLLAWRCRHGGPTLTQCRECGTSTPGTKGGGKPGRALGMPGAGFTDGRHGQALPERPAFQPYWGKPAVRNDRGDDGNVGIIRSPVRAIAPPGLRGPEPGSPASPGSPTRPVLARWGGSPLSACWSGERPLRSG